MWFIIPYYHKIFILAVLWQWLIYDCETECSFVYMSRFLTQSKIMPNKTNMNLKCLNAHTARPYLYMCMLKWNCQQFVCCYFSSQNNKWHVPRCRRIYWSQCSVLQPTMIRTARVVDGGDRKTLITGGSKNTYHWCINDIVIDFHSTNISRIITKILIHKHNLSAIK